MDSEFMKLSIEVSRKCKPEDGRIHPVVGVVAVRDGEIVGTAYRGELAPGDHAEFTLLEKQLPDAQLTGAVVYTTLEPCTTRNHPKVPCVMRLIERRVKKVFIGMLDPNPLITGMGEIALSKAGIETQIYPMKLKNEIMELNREFIRDQEDDRLHSVTSAQHRAGDVSVSGNVAAGDGTEGPGGHAIIEGGTGRKGASGGNVTIGPGTYKAGDGGLGGSGGDLIIKGGDAE